MSDEKTRNRQLEMKLEGYERIIEELRAKIAELVAEFEASKAQTEQVREDDRLKFMAEREALIKEQESEVIVLKDGVENEMKTVFLLLEEQEKKNKAEQEESKKHVEKLNEFRKEMIKRYRDQRKKMAQEREEFERRMAEEARKVAIIQDEKNELLKELELMKKEMLSLHEKNKKK